MTQDLLEKPAGVADQHAVDPEALIEEARQHARRRRLRTLAAVLTLGAIGGATYGIIRTVTSDSTAVEHLPNGPFINSRAFAGHGTLAFVSRGKLWVLDGHNGSLRLLPANGFPPTQPAFSPDGKWLAYLQPHHSAVTDDDYSRLWIARSNGTDPHVVPGIEVHALFGWSPRADLLAVSTGPERRHQPCPCYSPTELPIVSPDLSSRIVARAGWADGATWSPDGRQLDVAAIGLNKGPADRLLAQRGPWSCVARATRALENEPG